MKKYELTDRLEYLMKIGLVDRSKLTQYKLAFRDPENNVKFKHYRDKILEVFFKIFDIVSDNNPIYEKVRQQVLINYRKNRDMKSRLNEAKGEKLKLGPEHQAMIDAHIKKLHDLRHTPEHLIKKHNELLGKYKEAKLPPSFSTAIQAKSVKAVKTAYEKIAAKKSYETASKTREDKQFQRDVTKGLEHERKILSKPLSPRPSKDPRNKDERLYDRVKDIASKSKKPVGNFVQRTIQKIKNKMRPAPEEIATKAVARYRGNIERNKERKAAEEAVKKKALDSSNVAKVKKSKLAKRLIRMANEERKYFEPSYGSNGSARVNVTEMKLGQSGVSAKRSTEANARQEVNKDRNELQADKNKAQSIQNQENAQRKSTLNKLSKQHEGPKT